MHIQGMYETSMSTEAFNPVGEYLEDKARKSNTQNGDASFSGDTKAYSQVDAERTKLSVGLAMESPNVAIQAQFAKDSESSNSLFQNSMKRDRTVEKDMDLREDKSKNKNKNDTMVAVMQINIIRYQVQQFRSHAKVFTLFLRHIWTMSLQKRLCPSFSMISAFYRRLFTRPIRRNCFKTLSTDGELTLSSLPISVDS